MKKPEDILRRAVERKVAQAGAHGGLTLPQRMLLERLSAGRGEFVDVTGRVRVLSALTERGWAFEGTGKVARITDRGRWALDEIRRLDGLGA